MKKLLAVMACALVGTMASEARAEDPAFLSFSLGYFDVVEQDDDTVEGRIEYRGADRYWIFKPFGGVMATGEGAVHGYAGVLVDIYLGRRLVLTPSFAPGLYYEGSGKDLGHTIQFRTQIELSYRFDDRSRLGLSFNHMSNAGLDEDNPGVESVALTYAIPIDRIFGP